MPRCCHVNKLFDHTLDATGQLTDSLGCFGGLYSVDLSLCFQPTYRGLVELLTGLVAWWPDVVADAARPITAAVVILVVQFLGCVVTSVTHIHAALDWVADVAVDQRVVDNLVTCNVPCSTATVAHTQAVAEHIVQSLVSQKKHNLTIG